MLIKAAKITVGLLLTLIVILGIVLLEVFLIPIRGILLTFIVALTTCILTPLGVLLSLRWGTACS